MCIRDSIEISPNFDADSVTINIATLDPNDINAVAKVVDFGSRLIMMTRRASISYRKSSSMVLPLSLIHI